MIKIKEDFRAIDRGEKFILRQLKELGSGVEITTGIQSEDYNKVATFRKSPTGNKTPLGVYTAMQEFGTKTSPARPFMRKTVEINASLFEKQTISAMRSMYNGNLTIDGLLKRQANRTRRWMRSTIKTWISPPNTAETIDRKKRLGRYTEPLQSTRTMFRNIKSKTRKKGGGIDPRLRRFLIIANNRLRERVR
jgi:hypothetical protein